MSEHNGTIGIRIANEFSRDKVHLTDAEQRRLAGLIDAALLAELADLREKWERAKGVLEKCQICRGKGKRWTSCSLCGDSTYDHECNDKEVTCEECGGTGHTKAAQALLRRPPRSRAERSI